MIVWAAIELPFASEGPIIETLQPLNSPAACPLRLLHARVASVLSDPLTDNYKVVPRDLANVNEGDVGKSDWEDKLLGVDGGGDKIKIKVEMILSFSMWLMKLSSLSLPLSQNHHSVSGHHINGWSNLVGIELLCAEVSMWMDMSAMMW